MLDALPPVWCLSAPTEWSVLVCECRETGECLDAAGVTPKDCENAVIKICERGLEPLDSKKDVLAPFKKWT